MLHFQNKWESSSIPFFNASRICGDHQRIQTASPPRGCRLWTSRWDFLESEGDIPDSWHLIWVHHKTEFLRFFLTVWTVQITQQNFGLIGFLRFPENAQFWGSSPLKIAFWGSEKWKLWISKHRSAQAMADVQARQITRISSGAELINVLQVSVFVKENS